MKSEFDSVTSQTARILMQDAADGVTYTIGKAANEPAGITMSEGLYWKDTSVLMTVGMDQGVEGGMQAIDEFCEYLGIPSSASVSAPV